MHSEAIDGQLYSNRLAVTFFESVTDDAAARVEPAGPGLTTAAVAKPGAPAAATGTASRASIVSRAVEPRRRERRVAVAGDMRTPGGGGALEPA